MTYQSYYRPLGYEGHHWCAKRRGGFSLQMQRIHRKQDGCDGEHMGLGTTSVLSSIRRRVKKLKALLISEFREPQAMLVSEVISQSRQKL